jgi:hypothetical protein
MDRVWAEAFPGGNPNMQHPLLAGQTPQVAALLYSMGAESALPLLARSAMDRRQFGFTEAGGQLYVTDPRSGQAVPVPGSRPAAASGFRWTEDGTRQEPIPGGPGEQIPADLAGRVALSQTAQPRLAGARDFYLNRMTVGESARHAIGGAMLAPGYRQAQLVADLAIETAIRAASGANAPEAEVQRYINQFTPRVTDPMEVRRMKLDMLDDFLRNYQAAATRGRGGVQAPQQGGDFSIRRLP